MGIKYLKDGDKWCVVYDDFKNLQESIAGFGETKEEALAELEAKQKNKDETDKCFLEFGEDGHLTCTAHHTIGAVCLMHIRD